MIKEIGSEFWDVPTTDKENDIFPKETKWFISGRSALLAIIKENNFKTVALPYWCCESMVKPFIQNNIEVVFYDAFNVSKGITADAILVMDYFGYTTGNSFNDFHGIVIRDLTHSIFSKKYDDSDYYFGSLRKWAGFYTGGFAWGFNEEVKFEKENTKYIELRKEAMYKKKQYINGENDSKEYLNIFKEAEELLDDIKIEPSCDRDIELTKYFDVEYVKEIRRNNAKTLMDNLKDKLVFPVLYENDCPLFVPIRIKNRNDIRKRLIENNIYCPAHWPISVYHKTSNKLENLFNEEISLICDQRYNEDDMNKIINVLNSISGDKSA